MHVHFTQNAGRRYYLCLHRQNVIVLTVSGTDLCHSPTLSACPLQSTVAVQTLLLSGVRRRGDLQRLGGTPGEALDQQAAHRWAKKSIHV